MSPYAVSYVVRAVCFVGLLVALGILGGCASHPDQEIHATVSTAGNNSPATVNIGTGGAGIGTAPCAGQGSANTATNPAGNPSQASAPSPNCSSTSTGTTPASGSTLTVAQQPFARDVTGAGASSLTGPDLSGLLR